MSSREGLTESTADEQAARKTDPINTRGSSKRKRLAPEDVFVALPSRRLCEGGEGDDHWTEYRLPDDAGGLDDLDIEDVYAFLEEKFLWITPETPVIGNDWGTNDTHELEGTNADGDECCLYQRWGYMATDNRKTQFFIYAQEIPQLKQAFAGLFRLLPQSKVSALTLGTECDIALDGVEFPVEPADLTYLLDESHTRSFTFYRVTVGEGLLERISAATQSDLEIRFDRCTIKTAEKEEGSLQKAIAQDRGPTQLVLESAHMEDFSGLFGALATNENRLKRLGLVEMGSDVAWDSLVEALRTNQ